MSQHSIIPPSSAGIWGKPDGCTGWVKMSQQYPETEPTTESMEGEASHELGAKFINTATKTGFNVLSRKAMVDHPASNGVIIDDDMVDAAEIYAQDVCDVMRDTHVFGGPKLGIETTLAIHDIHKQSFGTPDAFVYDQEKGILYIWDYKYGYDLVEVFENWQLINYASGIINHLDIDGMMDQFTTVVFRVIQPRAFHRDGMIREWRCMASDLRPYFNILHTNAHKALGDDAECNSGSHCKHCSARHACPTALKAGLRLYEVAGQPLPVELPAAALGVQLSIVRRAIKQLEYIDSGLTEQAKGLIKTGTNMPGWMVEQGFGREKWAKPIAEVIALGELMGIDIRKPQAVTPKQARKLGIDDAVIMAYSETPRTGLKLIPDNGNKAKKVFKQ